MTTNPLGQLDQSGARDVLHRSLEVMASRGWTQGATRDLLTGEVDILGAVALAAGALVRDVDDRPDLLTTSVPIARRAAALAAWETLEFVCDGDPVQWQDAGARGFHDVVRVVKQAINRLAISVKD